MERIGYVQAHHHAFWRGANVAFITHLQKLTPTAEQLPTATPSIHVAYSIQGDTLQVSFFVQKCDWLDFHPATHELNRADFLWENHCLECFFDVGDDGYVEMNFSPDGKFNLYQFTNYRTPDILPPVWTDGTVFVVNGEPMADYDVYHLGIRLDNTPTLSAHKINPTAILYHDGQPIFYAINHANPPDFHDKAYWQSL